MPNPLSKRLKAVYAMVEAGDQIADIGADHGQLVIELVRDGLVKRAYASDNKAGPYEILTKNISAAGFSSFIKTSLSDGLTDLPDFADTVVIAGLGGDLIADLLIRDAAKLRNVRKLILEPNSKAPLVRQALTTAGFHITGERLVEEKHFYVIIRSEKGQDPLANKLDIEFGPFLRREKSPEFQKMYSQRLSIIDGLLAQNIGDARKNELKKEKERILSL